jgi:Caspase domain
VSTATAIIYATRSGGTTIDQDAQGGNPFASALIELSAQPGDSLGAFARKLRTLTHERSASHQDPTWSALPARRKWSLAMPPAADTERRSALVLVVSSYRGLESPRLLGASHDERRISAMLARNGFSVRQGVAPDRASLLRALREFGTETKGRDTALAYCTGHGVECDGKVYLLPGDYPFAQGYARALLDRRAVTVQRIAQACKATGFNLMFFAGCRLRVGSA